MINKEQLKKIREFAIKLDWEEAFGGASKGNKHLERTVKKALKLARELRAKKDIVEAGAWLHDTNLEKTISGSTMANKKKVMTFLKEIGVKEKDIKEIMWCIESHDGRKKAKTLEAKIVHDADTLEKMGPLGIIRETWKRSQQGWTTEKISNHLEKHLTKRKKKLYTKEAKKQAEELHATLTAFFQTLKRQLSNN